MNFLPEEVEETEEVFLPPKEWRAFLDEFIEKKSIKGDPGIIERMSGQQQWCVNEIKKSHKRIIL